MSDLALIRHVVLDMDGTLYKGSRLFAQTVPFLDRLKNLGIGRTFLTNNTSRSKAEYVIKLQKMGIDAQIEEIYTPAESVFAYLHGQLPHVRRLAILGTPSLAEEFAAAGFVADWDRPEVVVVGFDTTLSYERLCRTAYWISRDLPFLATHPDFICPTDQPTVLVDCGAICACLTAATGKKPMVFGKPNPSILHELADRLQLQREAMLMVGDRIYTDMKMAQDAGVPSALVLSGETGVEQVSGLMHKPDFVVDDVGHLGEMLTCAQVSTKN
jgi:haloacid dehalogenase superfamily, subfamily IA, variant 1 with third motif having Dx(3-4)D or Dx(3-4)E